MFDRTHSSVTKILEKVVLGNPLEDHEKAVLTYTTLILRDYEVDSNDELVRVLRASGCANWNGG